MEWTLRLNDVAQLLRLWRLVATRRRNEGSVGASAHPRRPEIETLEQGLAALKQSLHELPRRWKAQADGGL
jgi:hypothetical protein